MDIKIEIGEILKKIIKENKLTQKTLSEEIGKSSKIINEYCKNKAIPSPDSLYKISKVCNIELTLTFQTIDDKVIVTLKKSEDTNL